MNRLFQATVWRATVLIFAVFVAVSAQAQMYINEIFFDPPDAGDGNQEYVELRGPAGMSLNNHYLVFLENEDTSGQTGHPGRVDMFFDLTGRSFSSTGFFSLRQRFSDFQGGVHPPNSSANSPINTIASAVSGWGNTAANNNVGTRGGDGAIENSGFTAMLIKVNAGGSAPVLNMDLDANVDNDGNPATLHDGLDYPNGVPNLPGGSPAWTILDSIGVFGEPTPQNATNPSEAIYGRTYARINFGPEIPGQSYTFDDNGVPTTVVFQPNITAGQTYISTNGFEIEHIARWGNSTGQSAGDWHVTNATNNAMSGYVSAADGFRQSGRLHDAPAGSNDLVETNQFVPYGANLTTTIGAANYPLNLGQLPWDYNRDGVVDGADYVVYQKLYGQSANLAADGNGSKLIEDDDYRFWAGRFGDALGQFGSGGEGATVPEPANWLFGAVGMFAAISGRFRRS